MRDDAYRIREKGHENAVRRFSKMYVRKREREMQKVKKSVELYRERWREREEEDKCRYG